jgi:hypothetical protein
MGGRDDDLERAYGDAIYDAWRSGISPDRVSYDRVSHNYYDGGCDAHTAADREVRYLVRQDRQRREERQHEEQAMEDYYGHYPEPPEPEEEET